MNDSKVSIRFLMMNSKELHLNEIDSTLSVADLKKKIMENWTENLAHLESVDQLKLIFSGKILLDTLVLKDVVQNAPLKENKFTIHMLVSPPKMKTAPPSDTPPQAAAAEEDAAGSASPPDAWMPDDTNIHFHGCVFNEDEVEQIKMIFDRKSENDLISQTHVGNFLKSYWRYLQMQEVIESQTEFPQDLFLAIASEISATSQRDGQFTYEEFLKVFFLFDNKAPDDQCPHGEKERVMRATQELHKTVHPSGDFQSDIFDSVFQDVDSSGDGVLSCKEVDLLYYMYCVRVAPMEPPSTEEHEA